MFAQEIASLGVFSGFSAAQLEQIAPFLSKSKFPAGSLIFRQDQPAKCFFLLLSGAVVIQFKPYDGPVMPVASIQPGGVFGWSSALGREFYTSTAIATQASVVFAMRDEDLLEVCRCYPETGKIFLERLSDGIAERLNRTHTEVLNILRQSHELPSDTTC